VNKITNLIVLVFTIVFIMLWFFAIMTFIKLEKDEKPLIKAEIPKETIDFFKNLPKFIDISFHYNPNPDPFSWGKYEPVQDMLRIEDSCFIVFYSRADSVKEYSKAQVTLSHAREAIPELEKLMKDYPYPYEVKKRKLPIYVANNEKNYLEIQKELSPLGAVNSVGVYIFEYSSMGTLTKGIVLSPKAFTAFDPVPEVSLKITLWHEMNHYVYFTNYDFINNEEPYLWYTEGCAEYFAGNTARLKDINKSEARQYEFENNDLGYSAYWVGYSAFLYYENIFGKNKLSNLIFRSYDDGLKKALKSSSNITLDEWERGWKNYVQSIN